VDQERGDALVLGHRYDGSLDFVAAGFFGLDELGKKIRVVPIRPPLIKGRFL